MLIKGIDNYGRVRTAFIYYLAKVFHYVQLKLFAIFIVLLILISIVCKWKTN